MTEHNNFELSYEEKLRLVARGRQIRADTFCRGLKRLLTLLAGKLPGRSQRATAEEKPVGSLSGTAPSDCG